MQNRNLFGVPIRTIAKGDVKVNVTIEETRSMAVILDWFGEQPCSCATIGHIADETGYSRETVRSNMKQLMAGDYAERRHRPTGTYRLIEDPR